MEIGVDIENINRFKKLDKLADSVFLNKIFTHQELEYSFSKKNFAQHLAVRFSAKEAIIKALSNFTKKIINYNDIEILKNDGLPQVKIKNNYFRNYICKISLSHNKTNAIAIAVVLYKDIKIS